VTPGFPHRQISTVLFENGQTGRPDHTGCEFRMLIATEN